MSGWNHCRRATLCQLVAQGVAVVSSVGYQRLELNAIEQGSNADQIVALTRQQNEIHQIAKCGDHHADLRAWATARATDSLTGGPPFAPAPS